MKRPPSIYTFACSRYLPVAVLAIAVGASAFFSSLPMQVTGESGREVSPSWPYSENAQLWPALDRLIERVPLDDRGQLLLNGRTAAAIQPFAEAVTQSLRSAERQRIRFLIQRGLPSAAEDVSRLSLAYLEYAGGLNRLPDPWDLSARQRLQRIHFGRDAQALFGEENTMIQAMREGGPSSNAD